MLMMLMLLLDTGSERLARRGLTALLVITRATAVRVGHLLDKVGLARLAQLHVQVALHAVDLDVDDALARAYHAQLAEAHVERRAAERAVLLLDDNGVDGARQRGRIDLIVELLEAARELAHVVHAFEERGRVGVERRGVCGCVGCATVRVVLFSGTTSVIIVRNSDC